MIYQTVIASAVLATMAQATLFTQDYSQQKALWENFKMNYNKKYDTMDDETHRFHLFLENLKLADHRNMLEKRAGGQAIHGITKFSDKSQVEFESTHLTADKRMKTNSGEKAKVNHSIDTTSGLVDWSGKLTTPVKDQGYCGSCWAFSATEQIESDAMRTLGSTYILSPEQITQCSTGAFGCGGGWTESAYHYVKGTYGLVQDSDYPYTSYQGVTGTCQVSATSSAAVVGVTKFYTVNGEDAMTAYVQSTGPLSVCLDASSWNSYTGGIMTVCGNDVDHCVQAVGVDPSSGGYWKVRNSWGTGWGEAGYIRLAYGANTCDITNDPTYTDVRHGGAAK